MNEQINALRAQPCAPKATQVRHQNVTAAEAPVAKAAGPGTAPDRVPERQMRHERVMAHAESHSRMRRDPRMAGGVCARGAGAGGGRADPSSPRPLPCLPVRVRRPRRRGPGAPPCSSAADRGTRCATATPSVGRLKGSRKRWHGGRRRRLSHVDHPYGSERPRGKVGSEGEAGGRPVGSAAASGAPPLRPAAA